MSQTAAGCADQNEEDQHTAVPVDQPAALVAVGDSPAPVVADGHAGTEHGQGDVAALVEGGVGGFAESVRFDPGEFV